MGRYAVLRLASFSSLVALLSALSGCGDNTPPRKDGGGGGGVGGGTTDGGDAGGTGGADARPDGVDASDGGMEAGGDVARPCYSVTFVKPIDGAKLTAAD